MGRLIFMLGLLGVALAAARVVAPAAANATAGNQDAVAVIIGNRDYADPVWDVTYAHNDADAIRGFVTDVLGYREGNIIDLRDATQAELTTVFGNERNHQGTLWQYVRPGESDVLVFYSGHGVPGRREARGYLLPVNADPNRP